MSLLDELSKAGIGQINTTLGESRSNVSRNLQTFVMGALPSTNRISGPLGGFMESQKWNVANALGGIVNGQSQKLTTMVGDGVRQIFDAIKVPFDTNVSTANPRIYQNGVTAAQTVWADIRSGNQKVGDIVSKSLEPLSLLKHTEDMLPRLFGGNATPLSSNSNHPTPYAMDLFRLAPKHKFLFVVEFVFNGGYDFVGQGQRSKNDFAVTIKEFDRPKVKYEYDDNVNYYNFRSSVIKRVVHDPLTIKFLDDRQNLAMTFFHEYMKATHPITAVETSSASFYESNGMNFGSNINSSSTAVLTKGPDGTQGTKTILKEIKVYHLYDFGAKMNVHHFTNPKVVSIEHDAWNMADSEGSSISSQFTYDGWSMELGVKVGQEQASLIGSLSNAGQYQMHPLQQPASDQQRPTLAQSLSPGESIVSPESLNTSLSSGATIAVSSPFNTDSIRTSLINGDSMFPESELQRLQRLTTIR